MYCRTRKYTVCRRVRASFSPEILQSGSVKGLKYTDLTWLIMQYNMEWSQRHQRCGASEQLLFTSVLTHHTEYRVALNNGLLESPNLPVLLAIHPKNDEARKREKAHCNTAKLSQPRPNMAASARASTHSTWTCCEYTRGYGWERWRERERERERERVWFSWMRSHYPFH